MNGSGGAWYGTFDLPAVSLAGGDYYVICANATTVPNCDLDVDPNTDRIQNGSPDGIRLLLAGATVDALSYEGDTLGSTEGTGTTAADSNSEGGIGLSRCADGADTDNNNADFAIKAITPGATNRVSRHARPGRQLRRRGDSDPRRPGQRPREPDRRHRRHDRGRRRRRLPGGRRVRRLLPPGGGSRLRRRPGDLRGHLRLQRTARRRRQPRRRRPRPRHRRPSSAA